MSSKSTIEADVAELEPDAEFSASTMIKKFSEHEERAGETKASNSPPQPTNERTKRPKKRTIESQSNRRATDKTTVDDPSVQLSAKVAHSINQKLNRVWHERAMNKREFSTKRAILEEGLQLFFDKHGHR